MTFYKDVINSNQKAIWVNGFYVGVKQGSRLMDAMEFSSEEQK